MADAVAGPWGAARIGGFVVFETWWCVIPVDLETEVTQSLASQLPQVQW
jgi:hypothetical protein